MYQTSFGVFEPYGPVLNGPGATKKISPFALKKLSILEQESVDKAKKYAKDQSIRVVLLKQTKQHEIQVCLFVIYPHYDKDYSNKVILKKTKRSYC